MTDPDPILSEDSVVEMMDIYQNNSDFEGQVVSNEEGAQAIAQAVKDGRIPELCLTSAAKDGNIAQKYLQLVKKIRDMHEHHFGEKDNSPVEDLINHVFGRLTEETSQRMKLQKGLRSGTFLPKG